MQKNVHVARGRIADLFLDTIEVSHARELSLRRRN